MTRSKKTCLKCKKDIEQKELHKIVIYIVQETFTKVWIKHEDVVYEKVKSYLFTTAYHAIVDWVKKEKRSGDIETVGERAGQADAEVDLQEVLHEALDRLPEVQKTVVLLRDYEGYNYGGSV